MRIRCMIVDDEPLAHKVLEKYISQVQSLELVANCKHAMEAINYLHTKLSTGFVEKKSNTTVI